ncbi:SDR family NAD(P)-dependent oxidoreductase [Streptomyces sp. 5-10]|uniref:SDR family NAD(P)-dependent oxidoreductase n=1 Tax=Streptomyces sp. 5-10 TaxID=878925 RepID=UPI00168AED28|nr:SDR family NAD(P)-dependent oxidoreductase [Streptomyces sp. 5-10]MBD3006617.1 SDR family oxidoreductase [Streptomyces sp. 5-10]
MADRKIALVTGAGRGLGMGMVKHLKRSGVAVMGTYFTSERSAAEATGADLVFCQLDVTRIDTLADFVTTVRSTLRKSFGVETFDYLFNSCYAARKLNSPRK